MTDKQETPPDWVLLEAAKRGGWWSHPIAVLRERYDQLNHRTYRELCNMILKYEQPPVDRKLLCAREAKAEGSFGINPDRYRCGTYDTDRDLRACVRAIELWEEGFGQ